MSEGYRSLNHSKFLLKYHVILVCKYRRQVLAGSFSETVKRILDDASRESDFTIELMESDKDHIHLLVSSPPKLSPLCIVRRLKQLSTVQAWKYHREYLCRFYWREHTLWTDGYFVSSIGNVSQETVRKYIENQG